MIDKFQAYTALGALCIALMCAAGAHAADTPQEIEAPAWFKISFLDLRDDIKEATAAKKRDKKISEIRADQTPQRATHCDVARGVALAVRSSQFA